MDPDEQTGPVTIDTAELADTSDADPAAGDEAEAGSAATEDQASDDYGHDDALIGDFTSSDIDLSHLTPTSDGEPDDDEDPTPAETVEQAPTGQAVVKAEDAITAHGGWTAPTGTPGTEPTA